MNRSGDRIPKLRTRGRANRRKLLLEAERQLAEHNREPLRFSDVFESAGVSRGSAYRIYISIDDLMQDLATEWITNAVVFLSEVRPDKPPQTWQQLSDFILEKGRDYWADAAETLRAMPRLRSNAPETYKSVVREFSQCLAAVFDRHFAMPEVENWNGVLSFYLQLSDAVFADSVRINHRVTDDRLAEAQAICKTYLAFYLPDRVPARRGVERVRSDLT